VEIVDGILWYLDSDSGSLIVKGNGTYMNSPCNLDQDQKKKVQSIEIGKGVYSIATRGFDGCDNVQSLTISDSVEVIGACSFTFLKAKNLTIPNSVKIINSSAFYACECEELTIGESVEIIDDYAFTMCSKVKSLVIPNSVKKLGDFSFNGTESLETLVIGNSLKEINWAAFAFSGVKNIDFGDSVEIIGQATFSDCKRLSSLSFPKSVKTIATCAFSGCDSLQYVTIPKTVTLVGEGAFRSCPKLTGVKVEEGSKNYVSVNDVLIDIAQNELIHYPIPRNKIFYTVPDNVVRIGSHAFEGNTYLTNVILPSNVTSLGYSSFAECHSLQAILIPASVTSIESSAFYNCYHLESVAYLGLKNPGEENFIFSGCGYLYGICVPDDYASSSFCGVKVLLPLARCNLH